MEMRRKIEIWIDNQPEWGWCLRIRNAKKVFCFRCGMNVKPNEDGEVIFKIFVNPDSLVNDVVSKLDGDLIRESIWYGGAYLQ